jgi:hypothetical protein
MSQFDLDPAKPRPSADESTVFGDTVLKEDLYDDDTVDPVYRAKAHVVNKAMAQIGMGKYQVNRSATWIIELCN